MEVNGNNSEYYQRHHLWSGEVLESVHWTWLTQRELVQSTEKCFFGCHLHDWLHKEQSKQSEQFTIPRNVSKKRFPPNQNKDKG